MYKALATGPIGVNVSFPEAVDLAARHGFEGISVSLSDVQSLGIEATRDLLEAKGVRAALTGMPVDFRGDVAPYQRTMSELPAFCSAMSSVGCTRVATWISPTHPTLPFGERFRRLAARTKEICRVLADYGMVYGLEYVGPLTSRAGKPNPFIHTMDGMLGLIAAVNEPNLGFLIDCWHWYTSHERVADLMRLGDSDVVVVHVNDAPQGIPADEQVDNRRAMPGETGVIDLAGFMGALDAIGYSGPVMVEPFSDRVRAMSDDDAVAATKASLDAIWPA